MKKNNMYDVVIIGGGPAGLTAAIYLARARYRVIVVEKEQFGGQITITSEVVNYPGVLKASGKELTETMRQQAENFGAEFLLTEVTGLDMSGDIKKVKTSRQTLESFGVLLATGAHPRSVGFEGEDTFRGRGVAYCATCDGEFFTGKDVFVVGGGFAAAEESIFLTKYAKHVTVMIRKDDFRCAKSTADAVRAHEKITVLTNTEIVEAAGDTALRTLRYKNNRTGEESFYEAPEGDTFGIFVFAGYEPETALVRDLVEIDPAGYVITDRQQKTNVDGLYAAGDICVKNLRQVVTAVGDGALAATELERYASAMQKKTGIHPEVQTTETFPEPEQQQEAVQTAASSADSPFDAAMTAQLQTVFSRMENTLVLKLYLDERPISQELESYVRAMAAVTDKILVETVTDAKEPSRPCVRVFRAVDGSDTGIAFHGVPGGHEFTSFVIGLYNAAGPGQAVDDETGARIAAIDHPVDLQLLVSLSCTMCPDLVMAAQKIAAMNPNVRAEAYDINHFPDKKDRYNVMSVPCMVINHDKVTFGKKNIAQLLDLI